MKTFFWTKFVLWITIAQLLGLAQLKAQISGRIFSAEQKPLEGAAVSLLTAADSSLVKTEISDTGGLFKFDKITPGQYRIVVSILGFKGYISPIFDVRAAVDTNLETILLETGNVRLNEVKVTTQKNFVEYKIDRTVINVEALISNTGTNALEVLEKSPGVMVDPDGNISLKGQSGVMVMIDNRPTYLTAAALAAYLKSLPSGTIDQIELITNPPARYDAAGNAGIINIKTKKVKVRGLNGSLSLSPALSSYWRHNESLNLNYRNNRFNFFANAGYNSQQLWRTLEVGRYYYDESNNLTSSFRQTTSFFPKSQAPNFKLGMDYYLNAKTTWGFVFTGAYSKSTEKRPVTSAIFNPTGVIDSLIEADNRQQNRFRQNGYNVNFSHQFDSTGRLLTFDLDYVDYHIRTSQTFLNNFLSPDRQLKRQENISTKLPSDIGIYSIRTDYEHPLQKKGKLTTGFKTSYVSTDNAANYFLHENETVTIDYDKTNRFSYKENINAAYMNFNRDFDLISVQAGLRAENTNIRGHQMGNAVKKDSSFTRRYTSLFPTFYLSYKLDSNNTNLNFSYGRRIGRPYYQDLNPFVFLLDKFSYFAGNPFLKPEFGNRFALALNYKNHFNISAYYNFTTNMQGEVIEQVGNVFISRTGNIRRLVHGGITLTANLKVGNWWTCNLYAELIRNSFRGMPGDANRKTGSVYGYLSPNNQFRFKNGWSAELSGFYITKSQSAQFDKSALFAVNAAVQKKVLADKATVKLSLRDVFSSLEPYGNILNIPKARATYANDMDSRVLTATFTYSFSKGVANKGKRSIGGSGSEQQRVKN